MLAGELYDPLDPELIAARERARDLCRALNQTRESEQTERRRILQELFGAGGDSVWMQPPFYCDYGSKIQMWRFLGARRKYWLLPIIIVTVVMGGLLVLAQGSVVAPFIYTLF